MGGFLGIGGTSAKTDRGWQIQSASGLSNLFNWALPQAKQSTGQGLSDLSSAGSFWKQLMSGNRSAVNAAVAPQVNTAQTMTDASRRQAAASGTARGGGTAGPAETAKDTQLAQIQNLLFGARTTGAEQVGKVGTATANVGANLAADAGNATANLGYLGTSAREQQLKQDNAMGAAIGQIAMGLLMA